MVANFFENLSNNYIKLYESGEDFNVIIEVGKSSFIKEYKTHSAILKYRSMYFRNELENTTKMSNDIIRISLKPHISIQQFEIIIRYIYGGVISLEDLDESFIFDLMLVACELTLEDLAQFLEAELIEYKDDWLRLQFKSVYKSSFQNNNLLELQKWCVNIVATYPNHIFNSEVFTSLQESDLISLIKRDDLQVDEIKIWNRIIEWGIAQNSNLYPVSETKNWSYENFMTLKVTLKNCLPYIRYFQLPGEDIVNYVLPFKDILEKNLWEDLIRKFMAPSQQISSKILPSRISQKLFVESTDSFSKIITRDHAAEITSWIDRKNVNYDSTNIPYEFKS